MPILAAETSNYPGSTPLHLYTYTPYIAGR